MAWERLKSALSLEEFVVDEQPLPVAGIDERAPSPAVSPEASEEVSEESLAAQKHLQAQMQRDLLTQLADIMLEQVKLADKARRLEARGAGDDEFGRFVRQALPFLDNFARLLDMAREYPASEELNNWLKSVEALYFRLVNLLESFGLVFINSIGKPVDLDFHEVVEYRNTREHSHNTVIRELQKGIVFRGRLIRDAKVVVACNQ